MYLDLLHAGAGTSGSNTAACDTATARPSVAINVSAALGSNGLSKSFGGLVATTYGMSNTAVNFLTFACAVSFPFTVFLAVHPGLVQTDMAPKRTKAPVTVGECALGIRHLFAIKILENSVNSSIM